VIKRLQANAHCPNRTFPAASQHILDFVEAHVRVGRHQVLDRRGDPGGVTGSVCE
jgi:hypothetical protein